MGKGTRNGGEKDASKSDDWKTKLLKSGQPFESSVAKVLRRVGCLTTGSYEFETINERGEPIARSVDWHAVLGSRAVPVDLLVECKYRRPGTCWVFGQPGRGAGDEDWITNALVSPFVPAWAALDRVAVPPMVQLGHSPAGDGHKLPRAGLAFELRTKSGDGSPAAGYEDIDDSGITTGLFQLRYASTHRRFGAPPLAPEDLDGHIYSRRFQFTLPILVTTAELRLVQADVGVDEVLAADTFESVADVVPALMATNELPRDVRSYGRRLFDRDLAVHANSSRTAEYVEQWLIREQRLRAANQGPYAAAEARCGAEAIIVVNDRHLDQLLSGVKALLDVPENLARHNVFDRVPGGPIVFDPQRYIQRAAK